MRRLPWVDFNSIIDNTESSRKQQIIFDLSQNILPDSADDIYYVYHDENTNTFSIEVDEYSEKIQNFIGSIMLIDARLQVEDLSPKKRQELIKKRKMKIKQLEKTYGSKTLAKLLNDKLTEKQKKDAEEKIFHLQKELNAESDYDDKYFYEHDDETEEFELKQHNDNENYVINRIVAAILKTDDLISKATSRSEKRKLQETKKVLIEYLRRIQAYTLADALE